MFSYFAIEKFVFDTYDFSRFLKSMYSRQIHWIKDLVVLKARVHGFFQ